MSFFDKLFGQASDPAGADRFFQEGRAKLWALPEPPGISIKVGGAESISERQARLWRQQTGEVEALLDRALGGHSKPALPLAYRSLLKRLQLKRPDALKDADRAVTLDPTCFEAHAARAAALLTVGDPVNAMVAYRGAGRYSPHDAEGHYLNLILFLLFFEMITNAVEDDEGVTFDFKHTPITRGAVCLLDGYPGLALQEFRQAGQSLLKAVGQGLASYRLGERSAAIDALRQAADSMQSDSFQARSSVKRLLLEAQGTQSTGA